MRYGYVSQMVKANISELKNQLSSYLRKVRAGETVLVMDRGVPIARIERIETGADDARLARLEAAGLVKRPAKPMSRAELLKFLSEPLPKSRGSVLEALLEERKEGR